MRNGIVTIFSAPHLSSVFQRGGGPRSSRKEAPEKEERKKKKMARIKKMHHADLGLFFFWLYGNRGKGGMRMVYTEFLYSFIRDFLIINGRE